jgi:hypothetical protein
MAVPISSTDPVYLSEDVGPTVLGTASLMIILATGFVGLRYYARYLTNTSIGIEDFIVPLAWLAEMGLCITGIGKCWLCILRRGLMSD